MNFFSIAKANISEIKLEKQYCNGSECEWSTNVEISFWNPPKKVAGQDDLLFIMAIQNNIAIPLSI